MNISKLKELISNLDDNMTVLIPVSQDFDGVFYSPCDGESGVSGISKGDNDSLEDELLDKQEEVFMLLPCNFFKDKDNTHELN